MLNPTNSPSSLPIDSKGVDTLKRSARDGSPAALRETAKQFEALFLNLVMKSMRDATPQGDPLQSEQSKMFVSMLDQQFSQNMANRGIGLADVLVRQLQAMTHPAPMPGQGDAPLLDQPDRGVPQNAPTQVQSAALRPAPQDAAGAVPRAAEPGRTRAQPEHVRRFEEALRGDAEAVSRETGIPAKFMLAQAALETGWGKRMIKASDGTSSNNLFGIKAGPGWKGKVVEATTTEYVDGVATKKVERFRAYDSYADAFRDYGKLISTNPRYQKVMAAGGNAQEFAASLQRAGYATDPQYAVKLAAIINRTLSA